MIQMNSNETNDSRMSVSSWYFGQDSNNIHGHLPQVTWDGLVPQPATWLAQDELFKSRGGSTGLGHGDFPISPHAVSQGFALPEAEAIFDLTYFQKAGSRKKGGKCFFKLNWG